METKLCPNCKTSVNAEYNVCPNCGTALTNANEQNNSVAFQQIPVGTVAQGTVQQEMVTSGAATTLRKTKIKKPVLIAIISFVAIAIAVAIIVIVNSNSLSPTEKTALRYAKQIQNGLKDPRSFELYDDIIYIKQTTDDTVTEYYFFDYTAKNGYGGTGRQQDVFINGRKFPLDYEAPKEQPEYCSEKEWFAMLDDQAAVAAAKLNLMFAEKYEHEFIPASKIQAQL